jgi:hypothetical protein
MNRTDQIAEQYVPQALELDRVAVADSASVILFTASPRRSARDLYLALAAPKPYRKRSRPARVNRERM